MSFIAKNMLPRILDFLKCLHYAVFSTDCESMYKDSVQMILCCRLRMR